jgi:hypothetical protein
MNTGRHYREQCVSNIVINRSFLTVCIFVFGVSLAGCNNPFDGDGTSTIVTPAVVIGPAEKGTTFSNESAQISSYARGDGEGYGGMAWLDYDSDGDLDLFLPNEQGYSSVLFRNNNDGTFTDDTVAANVQITAGSSGVVVGDIDNDGCPDIFVSGSGYFVFDAQSPALLLRNKCDGSHSYVDISSTAGVPGSETALSAAMADINNDGFLDLFVTGQGHLGFYFKPAEQHEDKLYLNNGDLTFTDITAAAGVTGGLGSCVASFSHFDEDEFIDLFVGVCNDVALQPTPWHVYRNNGDSTFTDVADQTQLQKAGFWMAAAFGDIDNDGDFDIFSTNLGGLARHILWRKNDDGSYVDISPDNGDSQDFWAWGATFADWDNDNFQDLYYVGEQPGSFIFGRGNRGFMLFNNGDSRFTVDNDAHGLDLRGKGVTGLAKADYDNDGFVDFVVMTSYVDPTNTNATAILMRNDGNSNNSVSVKLEGTTSNRMAIGARIEIIDEGGVFQAREIWAGSSFASNESPWPVFGLGQATVVDAIVYWPCGLVETFPGLDADQLHHLVEGTGTADQDNGYCPTPDQIARIR